MRILHTITCTKYLPSYNADEQFTRHLIRRRPLTYSGIERMMHHGCDEYAPDPGVRVTHVETAQFTQ